MQSKAKTVKQYLEELPEDRKEAIKKVRSVILKNLPKGYEETMQYRMISYVVPLSMYPSGYLEDGKTPIPYVSLASQKRHMAVYLMSVYGDKKQYKWFIDEYKKSGKKLDMGKSCVRFSKLENLPLDLIGKTIAKTTPKQMIEWYKTSRKR